ncbi:Zinc carboxypeptidase [Anatilimnocola aggregata]|uniref:Zinc carboxypeptidase n=1 Tax=Anatilimnocola aggregata TaxID=2528021 RepID=A0A517YEI6_9BACT|nr:M14 family zinc carboxypeptidase [Anatilimnocola aggregata]QDU28619.1 Zinc carboxypeptidase [Anatilimnocola aggregata]
MSVAIRSDFAGGNVTVLKNEGSEVEITPDLRGGKPWFYWHFEATASQSGRVTFTFPNAQRVGVRGPAYSVDGGQNWHWLGADHVEYAAPPGNGTASQRESFYYDFTAEIRKVRFAVAIPYLQDNLERFLREHQTNQHLKRLPFAKTRNGTPIELLQIGEPGPNVKAMIVTARHHACESMASYVMEGWLHEAMSDSPAGSSFRAKHVLFAIPLVDKDGVQAGDQGKNRPPHDHNRDYGEMPLYPEIKAIQDLGEAQRVRYALDMHCPALRGDIHEAFHFMGLGLPHIKDNVNEFIAWLKEERPQLAMAPINVLADPAKPNAINRSINSHHFALRDGSVFAATLEIPYTQATVLLDQNLARAYGRGMLRAWNRMQFKSADLSDRGAAENAQLIEFRTTFQKTFRSKPQEVEAMAQGYLADPSAPALLRVEANHLLSVLRLQQKRPAEALQYCDVARNDPLASTYQQIAASVQRLQIVSAIATTTAAQFELALKDFQQLPYPALEQQAKALEIASNFHQMRQEYARSIELARQQLPVAAGYEKGKVLNRIASLHEFAKEPNKAIAARTEAVELLRKQLSPAPQRSVFGAMMVSEQFTAICGIPTATLAEKRTAGEMVLNHDIVSAEVKSKVKQALAELEE